MDTAQIIKLDAGTATTRSHIPVLGAEILESWLNDMEFNPYTRKAYTKGVKQFLSFTGGQPSRSQLKAWRRDLDSRMKPATTSLYIGAVRRFFQWINDNELFGGVFENVTAGIKGAKVSKEHRRDCLTADQAMAVLKAAETTRDKAIIALMAVCGLRDVEVTRADIEDLRTTAAGPVLYVHGKGRAGKDEYVKVPDPVLKLILAYLETRADKRDNAPLFTSDSNNSKGLRLSAGSISMLVKAAMVKAGYNSNRLSAHSLRHTAATLALMNGSTLQEVCQLLRHRNINTTMIYLHNLERMQNQSENRIANAIFGEPGA